MNIHIILVANISYKGVETVSFDKIEIGKVTVIGDRAEFERGILPTIRRPRYLGVLGFF